MTVLIVSYMDIASLLTSWQSSLNFKTRDKVFVRVCKADVILLQPRVPFYHFFSCASEISSFPLRIIFLSAPLQLQKFAVLAASIFFCTAMLLLNTIRH